MRVALLSDLCEPLGPVACAPPAIAGHELGCALAQSAARIEGLDLTCAAAPASRIDDAPHILEVDGGGGRSAGIAVPDWQDAAYLRLVEAGAFDQFDVVHCAAPIPISLRRLIDRGLRVVVTLGAAILDARALPSWVACAAWVPAPHARATTIPPSVDLQRFRPMGRARAPWVLDLTAQPGQLQKQRREELARALGRPVLALEPDAAAEQLDRATAAVDLADIASPFGPMWSLRALACGTPVGGFTLKGGGGLDAVLAEPDAGILEPSGEITALAWRLAAFIERDGVSARRRRRLPILALHNRRALAARYRTLYKAVTSCPPPAP